MERHLRLTPVAVLVLALLREGDMHPYEMMRLFRQRREDRLVAITNGTLYHTVGRLERDELIAQVGTDREGNRPERTTYTLTDAGRDAVTGWVRRELPRTDRPADFRLALSEAHNLGRDEVVTLLRQRRQALADSLRADTAALAAAAAKGTETQFIIEFERAAALLAADIDWLDTLLARLVDQTLHWGIDDLLADHDYSHREATVS
jgi:DNA-binding PadR family transcriptional regulator